MRVCIAPLLFALAVAAPAQQRFAELAGRHLPTLERSVAEIATADVDGDGDQDVALATMGFTAGETRLFVNEGDGVFVDVTATALPFASLRARSAGWVDVDGDSDPDLLLAAPGPAGPTMLYLNDGTGVFTDVTAARLPATVGAVRRIAGGDVDRDGDLDVLLVAYGAIQLLRNDGTGTFTDVTASTLPAGMRVSNSGLLLDVDNDGDLDVVLANDFDGYGTPGSAFDSLFLNNGDGVFADASEGRLPGVDETETDLAAADVDRDGDLDLVFAGANSADRLLLNDGAGRFSDAPAGRLPAPAERSRRATFADVDGDSDPDLLVMAATPHLYLNDGAGAFVDAASARLPEITNDAGCVTAADVDGDGDPDVLIGAQLPALLSVLLLNDGDGVFVNATATPIPARSDTASTIAVGDVDGDGNHDVVVGHWSAQNRLYLNDGGDRFGDATDQLPQDGERPDTVLLVDVDGDADLDLFFANAQQDQLYLNDGTGRFTDATAGRIPSDQVVAGGAAAGDIDLDGDVDLLVGESSITGQPSNTRVLENDGTGRFTDATAARLPEPRSDAAEVLLADVDGDGDLDLTVLGVRERNHLYLNDGSGVFTDVTETHMPNDSFFTLAGSFGDVDADGDLDLVLGNGIGEVNQLYLNSGGGRFVDVSAAQFTTTAQRTLGIALLDADGDGDLDAVAANQQGLFLQTAQDRLYVNDGTGHFTEGTAAGLPVDLRSAQSFAAADLDGDGDEDLVLGNNAHADQAWRNLTQQLDTPWVPAAGGRYRLDVYARWRGAAATVAGVFLSPASGSVELPRFGTLRLDPTNLIPVPPIAVPQPAGSATLVLLVPSVPALAGVDIWAQALVADGGRAVLTNAVVDRILP
ncbi:MAG: VCBS repeat-containing protein [Planctomycetota bacterium]